MSIEASLARALSSLLRQQRMGATIPFSLEFRDALVYLERLIETVITEIHPEFTDSLDGFLPATTRKIGDRELELAGVAILISDQTVTPLHVRVQISRTFIEISWMECRLGQIQNGKMTRTAYSAEYPLRYTIGALQDPDAIEWAYAVTFGERQ